MTLSCPSTGVYPGLLTIAPFHQRVNCATGKDHQDQHKDLREERRRYYGLPSILIDYGASLTADTIQQADALFDTRIKGLLRANGRKLNEKRNSFRCLFQAGQIAAYGNKCVRHSRNRNDPEFSDIRLQVIEAAVRAELFIEIRSPKRGPFLSRLVPTAVFDASASGDPWSFDHPASTQYVILRDRVTKKELPFDPTSPVPADVQRKLEVINSVNSQHVITCQKEDEIDPAKHVLRRLRPIHRAIFTDSFEKHGRLYTGKYGHQSLSKSERKTILIDRCHTVELDYGGFHPRLLYNIARIDYQDDPYALWGKHGTEPMRQLSKTLLNAAINAPTRADAISACYRKTLKYTDQEGAAGKRVLKRGKTLRTAVKLAEAQKQTGLSFAGIYDAALAHHKPIAHYFGSDMGITLMRLDSEIALQILFYFASRGIACLGIHDSFVVAKQHEDELRRTMRDTYERRLGFLPVVK